MTWLAKVIVGGGPEEFAQGMQRAAPAAPRAGAQPCNGLSEFLGLVEGAQGGRLLDLGPARQSTISFFLDRGFRVSTEDLLRSWTEFRDSRESAVRANAADSAEISLAAECEDFLGRSLRHAGEEFHGILAWDVFDYLEPEALPLLVARLHEILRPGGAMLGFFHSRPPESRHGYRIAEGGIEVLPARPLGASPRCFQNRELLNLFSQFRTSKTFVGRDQLRKILILK